MSDLFSKKIAEMFSKMDEKVLQARLNTAIEMLKKGNTEELANKLNKMDKNELVDKMNELDSTKLQNLNIDLDEVKKKISTTDLDKLSQLIGDQGDQIVDKLKGILSQKQK